jgi:hypothetical protein
MAARVLFGAAPPAGEVVPGSVFIRGTVDDAADPKLLSLDIWAFSKPYAVEWGDNKRSDSPSNFVLVNPATDTTIGEWSCSHAYAKPLGVKGYVEAGGVRVWFRTANFQVLPAIDANAMRLRQERNRENLAAQAAMGSVAGKAALGGFVNR